MYFWNKTLNVSGSFSFHHQQFFTVHTATVCHTGYIYSLRARSGPNGSSVLKQCITTAVASVDEDMLRSVWTELGYRIDICRVTKGSHIEHL